jgi:hypothetical protein
VSSRFETAQVPRPGPEEVARIAALRNPVLRNLEITHCYSRLAAAVAVRTGEGANWCTYATWASRQAGRTIRGEDLWRHFARLLGQDRELLHPLRSASRWLLRRGLLQPETGLGRLTGRLHTPFDAFERASAAVARGNLRVFEEIGLEFARYLRECPPDAPPDSAGVRRFLDRLRPGDPPDGQGYLRQAFSRYQRQRFEADRRRRAEMLVLANLEIGLHEQTRLQPEIREALDAAHATKQDLGRRALQAVFPSAAGWPAPLRLPAAGAFRLVAAGEQRTADRLVRESVTRSLMVLTLPGRVLALGVHLDDPFPEDLREPADEELAELIARYEPVPPAPDDCGARDWSVLGQRMHYISHLFRAFHGRAELHDPPFTAAQLRELERGELPSGDL